MSMAVKSRVVRIGNSQGIRIPRPIMEQIGLEEEVEMEVRDGQLIIRPAHPPRSGWAEQFKTIAERGENYLLDAEVASLTDWDDEEWEW